MTLQMDVRMNGGYNNIPTFSSKSAGKIIQLPVMRKELVVLITKYTGNYLEGASL